MHFIIVVDLNWARREYWKIRPILSRESTYCCHVCSICWATSSCQKLLLKKETFVCGPVYLDLFCSEYQYKISEQSDGHLLQTRDWFGESHCVSFPRLVEWDDDNSEWDPRRLERDHNPCSVRHHYGWCRLQFHNHSYIITSPPWFHLADVRFSPRNSRSLCLGSCIHHLPSSIALIHFSSLSF